MYQLEPHKWVIEHESELPDFTGATDLFLDVETQNNAKDVLEEKYAKKVSGMYPWKGDRICSFAVTMDELPDVYYVPIRHRQGNNLDLEPVQDWLRATLTGCKNWVNHNVVFDAMFCTFDNAEFDCNLVDTLALSKVLDTDKWDYGLKPLCREWCDIPMSEELEIEAYFESKSIKDYSAVPIDIMGRYNCADVLGNRSLYRYIQDRMPEQSAGIVKTETDLASVLYDMEKIGLTIDPVVCGKEFIKTSHQMIAITTEITRICGIEFSNSPVGISKIVNTHYNVPILATTKKKGENPWEWIDTGDPSFNKEAMSIYRSNILVTENPELLRVFTLISRYKKMSTYLGLFLEAFLNFHDELGQIHPRYNSLVRTGRMSASRPNSQQQNKKSKKLIIPRPGYGFISCDYSQIEFRLIVHYIKDMQAIQAYADDPYTDFHLWVAELLGVLRPAGKTLNFGMAYGAGEKTVTKNLVSDKTIASVIAEQMAMEDFDGDQSKRYKEFLRRCSVRAKRAFRDYHNTLPGISIFSKKAADKIKERGFVFSGYGRRRHLPYDHARKAFNSLVQGHAADVMKERMIALSPRNNKFMRDHDIRIAANVHDEVLFEAPWAACVDLEVLGYIKETLQTPSIAHRVPIIVGVGISSVSWAQAGSDDTYMDNGDVVDEHGNLKGTDEPYTGLGLVVGGDVDDMVRKVNNFRFLSV